jgi:hypothetical protein
MLESVIIRLKKDLLWKHFVEFFEAEQAKLLTELQSGSVKDLERLNLINSHLELFERLKNLDQWAAKSAKNI